MIKMHFKDTGSVSRGSNLDEMSIEVQEVSLFKSASSLKVMSKDSFDEGTAIKKSVPPIVEEETAEKVTTTTDAGGSLLDLVSSSNFAVSLILGGSMQQLWGMIRALQTIVICQLVRVPTPSIAFAFFTGCMLFA